MSDTARWTGPGPPQSGRQQQPSGQGDGANLADILERVLDKGIVIAGDIQVNLLDIELLTIKIRLVVASVDRAKEMGIDWWERDPTLSAGHRELEDENRDLRARIEALERNGHRETSERDLPGMPDEEPDDEVHDEVHEAEVLDDEPDDDEPDDDAPDDADVVDDEPADVEDEPEDVDEPDDEHPDEGDAPAAEERPTKGNGRSGRSGRAGRATGDRDGATRTGNGSGERSRRSRGDAGDGAEREMPARRRPGSKRSSPTRGE